MNFSDDEYITMLKLDLKNLSSSVDHHLKRSNKLDPALLKAKELEAENTVLQKKISEFEKMFSDLSKKSVEEKKILELKCLMLSQKVEDFEKVIISERDQFAKEKKAIDLKSAGFLRVISDGTKGAKKGFEKERSILEAAIRKLTAKLSELSKLAQKEKKKRSELEMKIDLLIKQRDSYSSKNKELTTSSTIRTVSSNRSVKSSNHIRSTNLFYDRNRDSSGTNLRKRSNFKEEELVWNKKPVKDELKGKNSCVHTQTAKKNNAPKSKPAHVYTRDQMIRLSGTYCQGGVREVASDYDRSEPVLQRTNGF
ncbi:hypothetical protein L6452_36297 [Arctium lappa]|uniref:Uncharacterized protein n=1 Tax=Arctium lappa TaxID=4217 RepID=A0ACB8Y8U1_ARCLA|nr:hypothetical protein L6452_36297 [Arctium lappa]